jgi:hypothetical protein
MKRQINFVEGMHRDSHLDETETRNRSLNALALQDIDCGRYQRKTSEAKRFFRNGKKTILKTTADR